MGSLVLPHYWGSRQILTTNDHRLHTLLTTFQYVLWDWRLVLWNSVLPWGLTCITRNLPVSCEACFHPTVVQCNAVKIKYVAFQANVCIRKRICRRKFAYFDLLSGVRTIFHNNYFTIYSFKNLTNSQCTAFISSARVFRTNFRRIPDKI